MVILLVVLSVLTLLSFCWAGLLSYFCFKILTNNFDLQDRLKVHNEFFDEILLTMSEDTVFLRSSLAKKFSLDIPETAEMNKLLLSFENKLALIKSTIEQYKREE